MVVTLEVLNTESNIRRVNITRTAVVGRAKDCGLRIASHRVSRRHCELILAKDAVRIRDLNSSNGTFVNNKPLIPGVVFEIDPEDEIRLGSVRLKVDFVPVVVERPILKKPQTAPPKGSLMGAIGAATASVAGAGDAEDDVKQKIDLATEVFADQDDEPPADATPSVEPARDEVSLEDQETVAAVQLPSAGEPQAESDSAIDTLDDVDPLSFLSDDDATADDATSETEENNTEENAAEENDEASDNVVVFNTDDAADDSAILDFLNNMD